MANYAVPRPRTSTTPFLDQLQGLTPASSLLFDHDASAAFEFWLKNLNLPPNYETALRRMAEEHHAKYRATVAQGGPEMSTHRFLDHLGGLRPERELMRMQPTSRFDSPSRFTGRVRTIAF